MILLQALPDLQSASRDAVVPARAVSLEVVVKEEPIVTFEMESLDHTYVAGGILSHNKPKPCWIAEAIYGADDPRTLLLRLWLNLEYAKTFPGNLVVAIYCKIGERVAALAKRSEVVKTVLRPLFDFALRRAETWQRGKGVHWTPAQT